MAISTSGFSPMPTIPILPSPLSTYLFSAAPTTLKSPVMAGSSFRGTRPSQSTPSSNLGAVTVLVHSSTGNHSALLPVGMGKWCSSGSTTGASGSISETQWRLPSICRAASSKAPGFTHASTMKTTICWQRRMTRAGPGSTT